jgi:predicted acetyltransferase
VNAPYILTTPLDPGTPEETGLQLRLAEFKVHPLHSVPAYFFSIVDAASGEPAGNINLRLGWDENLVLYAGHIGYGVDEAWRGRRFAARATRLLAPLAARHGFPELWITCNPDNVASRRSCELAGAAYVETVEVMPGSAYYERGIRQKCRYRLNLP